MSITDTIANRAYLLTNELLDMLPHLFLGKVISESEMILLDERLVELRQQILDAEVIVTKKRRAK